MNKQASLWLKGMYIVNTAWKYVGEDYMLRNNYMGGVVVLPDEEFVVCKICKEDLYDVNYIAHTDCTMNELTKFVTKRGGVSNMAKINRNKIAERLVLAEGLRKVQNIGDAKEFLKNYNELLTLREVVEIWQAYNKS